VPYRWLSNPETTRALGKMSAPARHEYFALREKLEDPRSAGAVPSKEDGDPYDTWIAPFAGSGLFIYRILDWDEPTLDPVMVIPPKPDPGRRSLNSPHILSQPAATRSRRSSAASRGPP
jgi:hypothetical protein